MPEFPTYLLLGPEDGEKKDFIRKTSVSIAKKSGETPETYRFYPYDSDIQKIVSILQNGSLFSSYKIVQLNNVEDFKKNDLKILTEYCKNPAPNTTLFLVSSKNNIDCKPLEKTIKKEAKKIFWEMFENQKENWIYNFFKKYNLSITAEAVGILLDLVQNNTNELKNECDKLAVFFSDGYCITNEDVNKYIYHSKEENIFTLFESFCSGSLEAVIDVLNKLLLSNETNPIGVLGGLLWQIRKLLNFKSMQDSHYNPTEIYRKLALNSKKNQKLYSKGASNYSVTDLQKIIILTSQVDEYLRSSKNTIHKNILYYYFYLCIKSKTKEFNPLSLDSLL